MKKILYIDFVSHRAHVNFNKLQLGALMKNYEVSCVFKQGYCSSLEICPSNMALEIPLSFYNFRSNGLVTRVQYWRMLRYIKKHIDLSRYDRVIYSYYEEISFFFAGMPKGAFLFNHVNLAGLSSSVKFWFYKQVSKSNTQLVFNEKMKDFLLSLEISPVQIVAHGIPSKYVNSLITVFDELDRDINTYSKVLFMPSATSANQSFMYRLLSSIKFKEYLNVRNYLLIVKGDYSYCDDCNVLFLKYYISDECYKYLLLNSDIIILPYHENFINRVSGVLFECIGNEKNVVLSSVGGLLAYKDVFCANPYFSDIDSLMDKIDYYETNDTIYRSDFKKNMYEPKYEHILDSLSAI